MWQDAGMAGLVLGLISTAYLFLGQFISGLESSSLWLTVLSTILWAAKFGGCIWFMMYFMKRFVKQIPEADNSTTFRFGMLTAALSALVYAAASFANISFIAADMIAEQTKLMMEQMAPMLDSNSISRMEKFMDNLPQVTFFSNLIYCFLFGTVLSFILSRNIPSRNPFANKTSDEW